MSSSDRAGAVAPFRVTSDPAVRITVHDATRAVRAEGEGGVELALPPGLYSVQFARGCLVEQRIVDHEDATELVHLGPPLRSPAPLAGAATSHDHGAPARRLSLEDTGPPLGEPPHGSRLFVFVRRTRIDGAGAGERGALPSEPITIHDADGRPLAALDRERARIDEDAGYAALSCRAAPGTYRIRAGGSRRDVAVTIPAGRAAHVFIVDDGAARLDDLRVSLVSSGAGFDPDGRIGAAMECLIAALRAPGRGLPAMARAVLPEAAEEDLCFGVAAAHLAWRSGERAAFDAVMERLARHRELPDVAILEQLSGPGGAAVVAPAAPPLLRASLLAAMAGAGLDAREVPARSALAQAARTGLHDSIWCTWSARTWDERWIEATIEELRMRRPGGGRDAASIARDLGLPASTIEEALQALDATTPGPGGSAAGGALAVPGYALGEVLGRGPKSTVFRATRQRDGRAVALKLMPLRGGADVCARVLGELERSPRVDDPRILAPTARGALPGGAGIWLELELCRGSVLDRVAAVDAPLPVEEARGLVLEALEGLARMHRRGIVHGDLKPGNLLVREDGSVVIADAGLTRCLAKAAGSLEAPREPRFAPPELLAGEVPVERTSDVWSMAATLHFLLTLEPPRDEYARQRPLDAARENPIVPLATRRADVPEDLSRCVDRALSYDMSVRPPDADRLRKELGGPGPGGSSSGPGRRLLPAALATLVLVAAILLVAKPFGGGKGPVDARPVDASVTQPPIDVPVTTGTEPTVAMIEFRVESDPSEAKVTLRAASHLDPLGATPIRTQIPRREGAAAVVVQKPGFETVTKTVDLTQDVKLNIPLTPVTPPRPEINVSIDSEPQGAEVFLQVADHSNSLKRTPVRTRFPRTEGPATVVVKMQGFETVTQPVDLTQDVKLTVPLKRAALPSSEINVSIDSEPQGADVVLRAANRLDQLKKTPVRTRRPRTEGPAAVTVQMQGFESVTLTVDLTRDVKLTVPLKRVAPPRSEITVVVESDPPGADVWLRTANGKTLLGKTPLHRKIPLSQARASVVISRWGGYQDFTQEEVDLTRDVNIKAELIQFPR